MTLCKSKFIESLKIRGLVEKLMKRVIMPAKKIVTIILLALVVIVIISSLLEISFNRPTRQADPFGLNQEYDNSNYDRSCQVDDDCILKGSGGPCSASTCVNKLLVRLGVTSMHNPSKSNLVYALSCLQNYVVACKCEENLCTNIEYNNPQEKNDCTYVEDKNQKKLCYLEYAKKTNDDSVCDSIGKLEDKINCKYGLALEMNNVTFCRGTGLRKDFCIFSVAHNNNGLLNNLLSGDPIPNKIVNEGDVSFFLIQDYSNPVAAEDEPYDREHYQGKTSLGHVVFKKDNSTYFHGRRFWTTDFSVYSFVKGNHIYAKKKKSDIVTSLNNVNESYFGSIRSIAGKIISAPEDKKGYFNFFSGGPIFIDRSDMPTNDVAEDFSVEFCKEMYDFALPIGGIDLISFYKDECITDVALATNTPNVCDEVDDTTIKEVCHEFILTKPVGD